MGCHPVSLSFETLALPTQKRLFKEKWGNFSLNSFVVCMILWVSWNKYYPAFSSLLLLLSGIKKKIKAFLYWTIKIIQSLVLFLEGQSNIYPSWVLQCFNLNIRLYKFLVLQHILTVWNEIWCPHRNLPYRSSYTLCWKSLIIAALSLVASTKNTQEVKLRTFPLGTQVTSIFA